MPPLFMSGLYKRFSKRVQRPRPPGPRGLEIARAFNDFRSNGLPALERMAGQYGDVVYVNLAGKHAFLLGHPDLIHHVLITKRENYIKMPGSKNVQRFFGNAMQLNNGEYARHMRRLMAPAFQPDHVARAYTDLIVKATRATIDRWEFGPRPGLTQELMDLILDVAVQIHFGSKPGEDTKLIGRLFLGALSSLSNFMLPDWVPTASNRRYHRAVVELNSEVLRRIRARRNDGADGFDLLSTFVRVKGEDGQTLSDQQIRDELITLLSAGYQSVAIALNQTLRLVAETRAVDTLLAEELHKIIGDRSPAAEDLARLSYTDKVIKESLRCCPPAGVIVRRAVADDEVAEWTIQAGARIFMSAWVTHRDPRFYDDSLAFKPERWSQEFERALPLCAYFPFGRGPRSCIAGTLATFIVQLMLTTIAQRYRLEALRATPAHESSWPTVLKKGGLQVNIHPREAATVCAKA